MEIPMAPTQLNCGTCKKELILVPDGAGSCLQCESCGTQFAIPNYASLGNILSEHAAGSGRLILAGCCLVFLMLLFGALSAFFIFYHPWDGSAGRFWAALSFGLLAVIPLAGLIVLFRRLAWRILLFENGLVFVAGGVKTILWQDVKYLRETRIILNHAMESDHQLNIEMESARSA